MDGILYAMEETWAAAIGRPELEVTAELWSQRHVWISGLDVDADRVIPRARQLP